MQVVLEAVHKSYPGPERTRVAALCGVSLQIPSGSFVSILGPSGSGKTTLLRLVAGLEVPDSGQVTIDKQKPEQLKPRDRDIAWVPQTPALFPHLTAFRNLALGLEFRGLPREEVRRRVEAVAHSLEITDCLPRRPHELSGGQRQRVSLGRALAARPRIWLLDEPFSALDSTLRSRVRQVLLEAHAQFSPTVLCVTHDSEETRVPGSKRLTLQEGRSVAISF